MSNDIFNLEATVRTELGKGAARRMRRLDDVVPAIVYGSNKTPQNIHLEKRVIKKALENEGFYSHILTLNIEGKSEKAVLKDIQRHPYKSEILHMDFLRVDETHKITMHVPLHFINEELSPGVKQGGIVSKQMVELEIRCLPKDLPEYIEIDLAQAPLEKIIHLTEIPLPKGVEIVSLSHGAGAEHDLPVVSIHKLRRAAAEEDAASSAQADENGDPDAKDKKE